MSVVLIAGPTASGKSRLALEIAAQENGVIVNADSMQVYRELRVLTARPSAEDEAAAAPAASDERQRQTGMRASGKGCRKPEGRQLAAGLAGFTAC